MDRHRLAALSLFAELPEHELDAVAQVASECEFASGEALATEGDFGHSLFVIEAGSAEVSSDATTLGTVGPGEVVGEFAVLASGRRAASVVARSDIRAVALFKRDVWELERSAPETARRLRAAIDERTAEISARPPS